MTHLSAVVVCKQLGCDERADRADAEGQGRLTRVVGDAVLQVYLWTGGFDYVQQLRGSAEGCARVRAEG
jgi:hypothetical protein